jgi:hypothetical protein
VSISCLSDMTEIKKKKKKKEKKKHICFVNKHFQPFVNMKKETGMIL